MAVLFNLDGERNERADAAFEVIADHVRAMSPAAAIEQVQRYQGRVSGLHIEATAKLNRETGSDRASKRAMNNGKTSKRSIAKAAKRGDAANKNAALADKVSNGDLSEEQLDVIADASAKTDGAAAIDDESSTRLARLTRTRAKRSKMSSSRNERPLAAHNQPMTSNERYDVR